MAVNIRKLFMIRAAAAFVIAFSLVCGITAPSARQEGAFIGYGSGPHPPYDGTVQFRITEAWSDER